MKVVKSLVIAVLAFSAVTASAQEERTPKTTEERAAKLTEKMDAELDLTDEQEAKVAELNLMVSQKIKAVRQDESITREQKREFIEGNMKDKRNALSSILTTEQMTKYDEMLLEKKEAVQKKKAKKKGKKKLETVEETEE